MRWRSVTRLVLISAVLAVSANCFKLARTSPPVERYVLGGALVAESARTRTDSSGLALGLRRLDLAPYLATLAIVVRRAGNEIVDSGYHRWAESPDVGLNRAVAGYLLAAPTVRSVDVAPWPARSTYDFLVQLHVTRFEGVEAGSGGASHVQVRWEIIRPPDDLRVARGVTDVQSRDWAVADFAGLVSRLDGGLVVLANEIVACLGQIAPTQVGVLECGARRP